MPKNKEPSVVSKSEIGKDGIVLDEKMADDMFKPLDPNELPDVSVIMGQITEIMEHMCTDEMMQLKKNDSKTYEEVMKTKYKDFVERYETMFDLIISGQDITMLLDMMIKVDKMKKGVLSREAAEEELRDTLAEKYIYSKMDKTKANKIKKKVKKAGKSKPPRK